MRQTPANDSVCPASRAGWLSTSLRRLITDPSRLVDGLVRQGDTVADIGCGPGFFTLPMAKAVGDAGEVLAVDVQPEMLDKVRERASRRRLLDRICLRVCSADGLGLDQGGALDFALAFWMVHEVPDRARLFREVHGALRPGGHFLVSEPKGHVDKAAWADTLEDAAAAGFSVTGRPRVAFSRAAVLQRPAP
jgi:ubiquinone/menaquinone biosynthesis C-methylase UbiE